ncbi:cytochrome c biogenesis protein CcdA [Bacillus luteus]|uniref:Cytochrome c biogenesis protein CcdA n=1 Tax=Alkalicoccus luteus TaxID=1237094 RepID=A0A969PQI1_9BACI|nr:cytochrome c biogenesis protein CcdA [Alkalicoccus luteus]
MGQLTIWAAFFAGVISFLSPCTLPLFPAYLSYITGRSVKELQRESGLRSRLMLHTALFLTGVSMIFFALGFGASAAGGWLENLMLGSSGVLIQQLAGIFIVMLGLITAGWLTIPALMQTKRFHAAKKPAGMAGTVFVGMGFAAGWTPCIGPVFGAVLLLAASEPSLGLLYTAMYTAGFAIPFFVLTFFLGSVRWLTAYSSIVMKAGGAVMIGMGILLFTGQLTDISVWILRMIEGTPLERLG